MPSISAAWVTVRARRSVGSMSSSVLFGGRLMRVVAVGSLVERLIGHAGVGGDRPPAVSSASSGGDGMVERLVGELCVGGGAAEVGQGVCVLDDSGGTRRGAL